VECLDEDLVLSFVDGKLGEAQSAGIAGHLAQCASCADLVATSAGGDPEALAARPLGEVLSAGGGLGRGHTVGRYVILNLVGRGGMGEVYAAYDPQLDRRIALKLLHETALPGASARTARERLLREAKAIARLSHPNVVVVHDAGAIDDPVRGERVFLAMEFVEGETLSVWLQSEARGWRAVRDVFLAAGEGLAAAHEAGLVHRDFKPQNVMVARDGSVRVMDFGLASDTSEATTAGEGLDLAGIHAPTSHTVALTRTGVLLGTPLYMAPEQFLGRTTDARSDQFSFCIALYEALYGERPFPSDSLSKLMNAVVEGRVREPPQRVRVPSFLRRLLLRGLAADPASRFPSMRTLLDALGADPVRRRRTALLAAAVGVVAVVVAAGTQRVMTRGQRMCSGAAAKLAGIWELGDGPRRGAIHQAFVATGRGFAEETWTRVSGLLDDYSRRWTGLYTDNCEATRVRGDQSAEVLDLRTTCLEGPRGALRALTDLLVHADGAVLVEAVNASLALPALDRCSDVAALRAVVPPPADAEARARVAALTTRLTEVKALRDTGQWKGALAEAGTLASDARAVGYEPLLADVLALRSWLEQESGDSMAAGKTREEVVWMALAAHRDDIAGESAAQLVGIHGYSLSNREEANRWNKVADALVRRLGPGHDRIGSWLHQSRGASSLRAGDFQAGAREFQIALSLKLKALPANDPDIAITYNSIAITDMEAKDGRAALAAAEQSLAIYRSAYGSASPLLWQPLDTRAEVFQLLGRYQEAESDLRSAVERVEGLEGSNHIWTAIALNDLGETLYDEHKLGQAIPILERALRIRERSDPSLENVAETRLALGRALWEAGEDRSRAVALATSARDTYRKLPGHESQVAEAQVWLAARQGRAPIEVADKSAK
jgi:eukaryotic-like serine/threonine-protein kinase